MKRAANGLRTILFPVLCICLCLFLCIAAADTGIIRDDDGGIWNYDNGTYTDPDGNVHPITPGGVNDDGGDDHATIDNGDGSITIITNDDDPVVNGLVTPPPEATRAPIEGDDWKALLDSVAARNGADTPTVWIDPVTDQSTVTEVVYMGIGRSMVVLDGKQALVNTVDLKWQTDAPEDKVLATIEAPKNGYAWLRKKPNSDKTNPKIAQVRTNSVVRVISAGQNWTLIDYEGLRGYVQSSSLEYYANDHTDFEAGYLSLNGKIKGNDTVWIRSTDKGERMLKECVIGTPVTVFDIIDDWAEIDSCGFHCRIKANRVTMEKEIAAAD